MKKLLLAASVSVAIWGPTKASSQECSSFKDQFIEPLNFNDAVESYLMIEPKDEFETTHAYSERVAKTTAALPTTILIKKEPESRNYFNYDADTQTLHIQSYAFDNKGWDSWSALYNSNLTDSIESNTLGDIATVIEQIDNIVGAYEASNSYGAKSEVVEIDRKTSVIFDRAAESYDSSLFQHSGLDVIGVPPNEARELKPQLTTAFLVQPYAPFTATGTRSVGKTTIRNPRDITESYTILFADIQCAFLLDGNNKVLGAYRTR